MRRKDLCYLSVPNWPFYSWEASRTLLRVFKVHLQRQKGIGSQTPVSFQYTVHVGFSTHYINKLLKASANSDLLAASLCSVCHLLPWPSPWSWPRSRLPCPDLLLLSCIPQLVPRPFSSSSSPSSQAAFTSPYSRFSASYLHQYSPGLFFFLLDMLLFSSSPPLVIWQVSTLGGPQMDALEGTGSKSDQRRRAKHKPERSELTNSNRQWKGSKFYPDFFPIRI